MEYTKISKKHITLNNIDYYRTHAEEMFVGTIGTKRTSVVNANYLEPKDRIPPGKYKIVETAVLDVKFKNKSKTDLGLAVSAIVKGVPVSLKANDAFNQFNKGKLKLVKLSVQHNKMKKAANDSPMKLKSLIAWGNSARLVHQIILAVDGDLAREFKRNTTVEVTGGLNGTPMKISLGGSRAGNGNMSVEFTRPITFAYLLAKIDWDAKMKKNRKKIVDLDNDQWSFG